MKQQDIAIIIIIVFIAGMASFFVSSKYIAPKNVKHKAEKVSAIDPVFTVPDSKVFNPEAVNPTVRIQIQPTENTEPFTNPGQ